MGYTYTKDHLLRVRRAGIPLFVFAKSRSTKEEAIGVQNQPLIQSFVPARPRRVTLHQLKTLSGPGVGAQSRVTLGLGYTPGVSGVLPEIRGWCGHVKPCPSWLARPDDPRRPKTQGAGTRWRADSRGPWLSPPFHRSPDGNWSSGSRVLVPTAGSDRACDCGRNPEPRALCCNSRKG